MRTPPFLRKARAAASGKSLKMGQVRPAHAPRQPMFECSNSSLFRPHRDQSGRATFSRKVDSTWRVISNEHLSERKHSGSRLFREPGLWRSQKMNGDSSWVIALVVVQLGLSHRAARQRTAPRSRTGSSRAPARSLAASNTDHRVRVAAASFSMAPAGPAC